MPWVCKSKLKNFIKNAQRCTLSAKIKKKEEHTIAGK